MESKKPKEEKDSKKEEKKPEEKDINEKKEMIGEENDIFLDLLKFSFMKEEENKGEKGEKKDEKETETQNNNKYKPVKSYTETNFLSTSLAKLQKGDDMDIMSALMLLCDHLSLSSDQIGDNSNMPKILEEVCKNLEKLYLPEIIIYSLQCINYVLDINPGLTSVLKRVGAIPKILLLISAMEDTACLDLIVSVFEKISFENSFLLLENNVLPALLNVIDFLGTAERKSIMKTCQNISANTITDKQFNLYIKPAMENLCYLTKFTEDNSYVNEKAILIYYNIIVILNQGYYFNSNPELENEISKYSFLDNFCEILKKYFIENNKKITANIVKKILKIIQIIFKISKKETAEKLLSIGILEIVSEIIHHEFKDVMRTGNNTITISNFSNNNNIEEDINPAKSSSSFLTELFSLLIALFPEYSEKENDNNKNTKDDSNKEKTEKKPKNEKILKKENEKYYDYLCTNIIKPLVNNIINKSACSTLNNLLKLILIFSKTADKANIEKYINSKQMAQIISKLLDTKYDPYVSDLLSLLEIFMSKVPEHFIKNLIREGIVENIKNYELNKKASEEYKTKNKKKKKRKKKNQKIKIIKIIKKRKIVFLIS